MDRPFIPEICHNPRPSRVPLDKVYIYYKGLKPPLEGACFDSYPIFMSPPAPSKIDDLLKIMRRLRDPETGCPWDQAQNFSTIAPFTIEEAYEVAGAIEEKDWLGLRDELGDLLLQVVFHSRIAEEAELFRFEDVVLAICEKMRRRHPHVFTDSGSIESAQAQSIAWEDHKKLERAAKAQSGLLDDIPTALPALTRAVKLQKRASTIGFDWNSAQKVLEKLQEESAELVEVIDNPKLREEEFGDLLFVMANLARHLNVDPEAALRAANSKFVRRFHHIESMLAEHNRTPDEATLDEMEALWRDAKRAEKEH